MNNSRRRLALRTISFGLAALTAVGLACTSSLDEDSPRDGAGQSCAVGQESCGGGCVELASDPNHCGACNNACDTSLVCSGSACTTSCASGETQCGAACANLDTSPSHCGGCNQPCGASQTCSGGTCVGGPTGSGGSGSGGAAPGTGGAGGSGGGTGGGTDGGTGGTLTVGPCNRVVGACTAPEVTVSEIDFGEPITPYGSEWDTLPLPAALASMPSGGTRVAARGTDGRIHVATLDCNDELVGTPLTLDAVDLQDIHADDEGGAVLLTRNGPGTGDDHCGPTNTCDSSSSPCYNSFIVRFDHTGEVWATPVTNLSDSVNAYQNGAQFVWERYQHHGRLAFDGTNYAAYFAIAITTDGNENCAKPGGVDVHQGDRMQVVSASGMPVNHSQAMAVGCSHSWTTRIVWDPRSSQFVMVCATDNPDTGSGSLNTGNPCRIARPGPYRTVAAVNCTGQFWGGDLVLAEGSGYWTAYTQNGSANLVRFTDDGPQQNINGVASTDHVKLVSFGTDKMLLAWESGSTMKAQIYDGTNGDSIGPEFDIDVEDHNYHAFKAFPDGSVAYPARGSTNTSIRVARVTACN